MDSNNPQPHGAAPHDLPPVAGPVHAPAPAEPATNPYSFILETEHRHKKFVLKGGSFRSKILTIVAGGVLLIAGIILLSTILNNSTKTKTAALITIAAEQQEIIRISTYGAKTSTNAETIAFSELTKLSLTSQQKRLTSYLSSKSVVLTKIELASGFDQSIDKTLASAIANNSFNEVLTSTLKTKLTTYAKNLEKSYKSASNPTSKAIMADGYKSTAILLK